MNPSSLSVIMNWVCKNQHCLRMRYKLLASSCNGICSLSSVIADKSRIRAKPKYYQFRIINSTFPCYQKDHEKLQDRILTIPNILSVARIAATPVLGYCIINLNFYAATGILVGASVTDFIDGWIARTFKGQASKLGSFLDPLADKLLVISLYGSMAYMHIIPDVLMGLIVLRDVALLSAGVYIRYISIPPPRTVKKYFDHKHSAAELSPTMLSKVNTAVQLVTAIVSLYGSASANVPHEFLMCLWYLAGLTTISSGVSYIFAKNTYKIISSKKQ